MKIILSIDSVRFPLTGIGRYTFELARHLKEIADIEQLRFLSGYRFASLPEPMQSAMETGLSTRHLRGRLFKNPLTIGLYSRVSPLLKQVALRGNTDHVFHGPNFYIPPFEGPSVCTFHDLSIFTWAHCHPPERVRYMRTEIAKTLKRADMLITDTDFTRREVAAYFGWSLDKIRVVPLACSEEFRPRCFEELNPILTKHSLTWQGYSLYVGTIEPRKNLEVLLDAYALLPPTIRQQWPLVMVGYKGWRSEQLHARIEAAVKEGWVTYLGFVEADELPLLYAGARVFVFPSLYEGFGLPLLEAMASGIPVVCSNAATLPEVTGDAAAMCDPQDVDGLSELINRALQDESWRKLAIKKGLLQAGRFSWKRCAEETAAVYKEVLA
ncbi:MAG: glycosyltransferase family 1 protein [Methylococcales bacterium]|nr:glycosyltransferase family 1 protein [Methylococcales bacterium]